MDEIIRSMRTMLLLTFGAGLYAVGALLGTIAWAILDNNGRNLRAFRDLGHAHDWLLFVGILVALAGVASAGWQALPRRQSVLLTELGIATISTLLITIGSLVEASSDSSDTAANVVVAIGVGGWALMALARAARYNLAPQDQPAIRSFATPWLTIAGALLLFAVGSGLTVTLTDRGTAIAAGVLNAIAAAVVAQVLLAARRRRFLLRRTTVLVIVALLVNSASWVTAAVVAGLEFTRDGTLTGLRIGLGLVGFMSTIGVLLLAAAAWDQVRMLADSRSSAQAPSGWAMPRFSPDRPPGEPASPADPPSWSSWPPEAAPPPEPGTAPSPWGSTEPEQHPG